MSKPAPTIAQMPPKSAPTIAALPAGYGVPAQPGQTNFSPATVVPIIQSNEEDARRQADVQSDLDGLGAREKVWRANFVEDQMCAKIKFIFCGLVVFFIVYMMSLLARKVFEDDD